MYFKLIQEIEGQFFGREEYSPMILEYSNGTVTLKSSSTEDNRAAQCIKCETTIERNVNAKINSTFEELAQGVYKDSEKAYALVKELKGRMDKGEISGYSLPYDILPNNFKDFINHIHAELQSFSTRSFKTLRWISNLGGPVKPFRSGRSYWSSDGIVWHDIPGKITGEPSAKSGIRNSDDLRESVILIVQNGDSEPLGHELLLEAFSLQMSYPRSALLIGITAAETGIKQFITNLQPEAKWIIENVPSPDILKLMREYLPTLAAKKIRSMGKSLFPDKL